MGCGDKRQAEAMGNTGGVGANARRRRKAETHAGMGEQLRQRDSKCKGPEAHLTWLRNHKQARAPGAEGQCEHREVRAVRSPEQGGD